VFVLAITGPDGTTRRQIFTVGEITIGSNPESHVYIPGADLRHARIVVKDLRFVLVDMKSTTGTWVNERRFNVVVVKSSDKIRVIDHSLQIIDVARGRLVEPFVARDATERDLLAAINAGDEASRLVYGDWLESAGELERAEIVRRVGNGGRPSVPFLRLLIGTAPEWRACVVRPPIEGCGGVGCPGDWGALRPSDRPYVRTCGTCTREVRYCSDTAEAREQLAAGGVAVLDPLSLRSSGDLQVRAR
jgi:uncharacterized protein (TIGR02996 family)